MVIIELKVQYSHFPFASKFSELGRVVESGIKITLDSFSAKFGFKFDRLRSRLQ